MGIDCVKDMELKESWPILATAQFVVLNLLRCTSTSLKEWYSECLERIRMAFGTFAKFWRIASLATSKIRLCSSLDILVQGTEMTTILASEHWAVQYIYCSSIEPSWKPPSPTLYNLIVCIFLYPSIIVNDNFKKQWTTSEIQAMPLRQNAVSTVAVKRYILPSSI